MNEVKTSKKQFIAELEKVFILGQPHFVSLEYFHEQDKGEFVIAKCENGAKYKVDVTGDSLPAMVYDIYLALRCK